MRVQINIMGRSPLLMHNERLSDPDDEYVRQIKEITSKKKNQTDSDRDLLSKLEWRGGLYEQNGEVVIPTANLIRCFREAGKVTKAGQKIVRGISPAQLSMPLVTDGPRKVDILIKDQKYFDRRQVKVGTSRVKRTRPIFPVWSLAAAFELIDDVLNLSELVSIADLAGRAVGLCDARILGYGRFEAKIVKS